MILFESENLGETWDERLSAVTSLHRIKVAGASLGPWGAFLVSLEVCKCSWLEVEGSDLSGYFTWTCCERQGRDLLDKSMQSQSGLS